MMPSPENRSILLQRFAAAVAELDRRYGNALERSADDQQEAEVRRWLGEDADFE